MKFAVDYHKELRPGGKGGFFGCSVSFATSLLGQFGYFLLQLDFSDPPHRHDAMLVREEYRKALGASGHPDETVLYDAEPYTPGPFLDVGVDSQEWRSIDDPQALLSEIAAACKLGSIAKHSGKVLPFVLTL